MKNLFLSVALIIVSNYTFAQSESNFSSQYKTIEQTVGSIYILTIPMPGMVYYPNVRNAKGVRLTTNDLGKSLKLQDIDKAKGVAHFKDSMELDYSCTIFDGKRIPGVILKSDIETAKNVFLNKMLWLNISKIDDGKYWEKDNLKEIGNLRFEPVTIIDVSAGYLSDKPILFSVKTKNGQYGHLDLTISGTNTSLKPEDYFAHYFLTEDPHLKYHFTPAVWKMVQAGYTEIGMPMEAFQLVMGPADKINTTQTAKGVTQQWVYGSSYYYFANGKLTAKQN